MGENGLLQKVKHAITSNTTVKGLTRDLQDAGIKVKNELEAVILAEDYWIKINEIERGPLENYKVSELKELPFTSVRNNGIEYRIHGIIHNGRNSKLSEKTKNFIKESIIRFSNAGKREDCLLERNLSNTFEIKEINAFKFGLPYFIKTYLHLLADKRKHKVLKKDLSGDLCLKIEGNFKELSEMIDKTNEDVNYLPLLKEVYARRRFPMPLEFEKERLKRTLYTISTYKRFTDKLLNYLYFPSISKEFVKYMEKFATENNLKTLHFITGLVHESEIAYYLKDNL